MLSRNVCFATAMVCLFARAAAAENPESRPRPVVIVASHSILPKGLSCRIELSPESISESETSLTFYEGTISETTDDGIRLTAATIESHSLRNSPYSRLPFLGRYFKNTGIGRSPVKKADVLVPVAKIKAITLLENPLRDKGIGEPQMPLP